MKDNTCIVLRERPTGIAGPEHFDTEVRPVQPPQAGEALLETLYVSVDPAMRVWVSEEPGYVEPIRPGDVMRAGGIARVVESRAPGLAVGTIVQGRLGWQSRPTLPARYLLPLDLALGTPLDWIGPLGGTALTAYFGLREVGRLASGDRVLVSAAAGGVGQIAAQIAKLEASRVVGIAGGGEKCDFLTAELGLHAAIDYRAERDLGAAIGRAMPEGIDVYFDNVGGPTLDAALAHLRPRARVVLCGRISQTASEAPYGVRNLGALIGKRARLEGFIVMDFSEQFPAARAWLSEHVRSGRIKQRLQVLEGLERAPEGLRMLFRSENTGKLVVRVAAE